MAKKKEPPTEQDLARGKRILTARRDKRWSQSELGRKIGKESQSISLYERGEMGLSADALIDLAKALGRSPEWILRGIESTVDEEHVDTRGWRDFVAGGYVELFRARGATDEQLEHARRTPFKGMPRSSDYVRLLEDVLATDASYPEPEELSAARRRAQERPDLSVMLPAVGDEKDR